MIYVCYALLNMSTVILIIKLVMQEVIKPPPPRGACLYAPAVCIEHSEGGARDLLSERDSETAPGSY